MVEYAVAYSRRMSSLTSDQYPVSSNSKPVSSTTGPPLARSYRCARCRAIIVEGQQRTASAPAGLHAPRFFLAASVQDRSSPIRDPAMYAASARLWLQTPPPP